MNGTMSPASRSIAAAAATAAGYAIEAFWRQRTGVPLPLALEPGLALALLLTLGPAALPGVVVASLLSGAWHLSAQSTPLAAVAVVVNPALAWLASRLLVGRRPRPPRLGSPRQLAHFAVVCVATAGLRALFEALRGLPFESLLQSWVMWTSGLLILPPALMCWLAAPREDWRPRRMLVGVLIPGLVALGAIGLVHVGRLLHEQDATDFRQHAADRNGELQATLHEALDVLATVRSLHALEPQMDRAAFASAVREWSQRDVLHALGIAVSVRPEQMTEFESLLREDQAPDPTLRSAVGDGTFRVLQPGEGIVAIRVIEPWDRNAQVLGTNSYANPAVAEAIDRAGSTGSPASTAPFPLRLTPGANRPAGPLPLGIVIYQAVQAADGGSAAADRGFAFVTLRIDQVARAVQRGAPVGMLLCLLDDQGGTTRVLAEHGEGGCARTLAAADRLSYVHEIGGRRWKLIMSRSADPTRTEVATAAAGVAAPIAMLTLLLLSMTGHARLVRRAAARARAAQQAAEASSRAKSDFLARISHELRAPLNGMIGYAQLLASADPRHAQVPRWAHEIEQAGWHLRDLIDDLLDTGRIDSGSVEVRDDNLPLVVLVREAVGMLEPQARELGLAMTIDAAGDARWRVRGDARRIRQALVNLLSNAIKYNRTRGEVHVRVEADGTDLAVRVQDTGLGMTAAQVQGLFEPFARLGREELGIEGTGLGLFVTRRLVELMGGRVEVSSRQGEGSTFSLVLRRAPDAEAGEPGEGGPVRTVMAFEDDPVSVELLEAVMRLRPRARLVVRRTAADALAAVRAERPSLLLLDRHLPGGDGIQVLQALQADAELAAIPVLLTSGAVLDERSDALSGVRGAHPKPWKLDELGASIDEQLSQARI